MALGVVVAVLLCADRAQHRQREKEKRKQCNKSWHYKWLQTPHTQTWQFQEGYCQG